MIKKMWAEVNVDVVTTVKKQNARQRVALNSEVNHKIGQNYHTPTGYWVCDRLPANLSLTIGKIAMGAQGPNIE